MKTCTVSETVANSRKTNTSHRPRTKMNPMAPSANRPEIELNTESP